MYEYEAKVLEVLRGRFPTHSFSILRLEGEGEGDGVAPRTRIILDKAYGVEYSPALMLGLMKPAIAAAAEACLIEDLAAQVSSILRARYVEDGR